MQRDKESPVREYRQIIQDSEDPGYINRILIGTATTGLVRVEWHAARMGAITPANWATVETRLQIPTHMPLRYQVDDAQNLIVKECIERDFEWLFLLEHDVIIPHWMWMTLNHYIYEEKTPVVSGLYFLRAHPSEPLVYRGRGTGAYFDWKLGERVWADGVPTGCLLIHSGILREMWKDAEEYTVGNQTTRRVFKTARMQWVDPERGNHNMVTGTSDLNWCTDVIKGDYFNKAGWGKFYDSLPDKRYPFLVDTALFCVHMEMNGNRYPNNWQQLALAAEYEIGQRAIKPTVEAPNDLGISVADGVKAKAIFGSR